MAVAVVVVAAVVVVMVEEEVMAVALAARVAVLPLAPRAARFPGQRCPLATCPLGR